MNLHILMKEVNAFIFVTLRNLKMGWLNIQKCCSLSKLCNIKFVKKEAKYLFNCL